MHHYKSKSGIHWSFNSDLSGDVTISAEPHLPAPSDVDGNAVIAGADLLEFVDWWRSEYAKTED